MTRDELKEKILREVTYSHERLTKRRIAVRLGETKKGSKTQRLTWTEAFDRAYRALLSAGSIHEIHGIMDEPIVQIEPPAEAKPSFVPASEPPLTVGNLKDLELGAEEVNAPVSIPVKKPVSKVSPKPVQKAPRKMRSTLELHRAINDCWNEALDQGGAFTRAWVLHAAGASNGKRGPVVDAMDAAITRLVVAGWSKEARGRERDVPIKAHDSAYGDGKKPNPRQHQHQRKVTPEQIRALEAENQLLQSRLDEALSSPGAFLWQRVEACNESIADLQQQRQDLADQITAQAKQRDSLMAAIQALENPVTVTANGRGSGRLELKEAG